MLRAHRVTECLTEYVRRVFERVIRDSEFLRGSCVNFSSSLINRHFVSISSHTGRVCAVAKFRRNFAGVRVYTLMVHTRTPAGLGPSSPGCCPHQPPSVTPSAPESRGHTAQHRHSTRGARMDPACNFSGATPCQLCRRQAAAHFPQSWLSVDGRYDCV